VHSGGATRFQWVLLQKLWPASARRLNLTVINQHPSHGVHLTPALCTLTVVENLLPWTDFFGHSWSQVNAMPVLSWPHALQMEKSYPVTIL
jgi:hypothetical protein